MKERFSKSRVVSLLYERKERIAKVHGFKEGDGWAVVDRAEQARVLAFGQFDALRDALDDIEAL